MKMTFRVSRNNPKILRKAKPCGRASGANKDLGPCSLFSITGGNSAGGMSHQPDNLLAGTQIVLLVEMLWAEMDAWRKELHGELERALAELFKTIMQTTSTSLRLQLKTNMAKLFLSLRIGIWLLTFFIAAFASPGAPIPVILDTDIGGDIDDTWALTLLLKSPQFDLKLVTTTSGKAEYRAKIAAKLLTTAGRTDVAVGLGAGGRDGSDGQLDWVRDYKLSDYPGHVFEDGVQALIDTVKSQASNGTPVTIIAIGPLETLNEALTRDPDIARKANFVGMDGSVRKGYNNKPKPEVEWNMHFVPGAKRVFAAPWRSFAITPLDTCGLVRLSGSAFEQLKTNQDTLVQAMLENYRIWSHKSTLSQLTESSVLYDTVAVYLADPGPKPLLGLETLNISVSDQGMTIIDLAGARMTVATTWKNLPGYRDFLVRTLTGPTVQKH